MKSPSQIVPPLLFKYVTAERLDVLKNECVRFTQPAALNDPWELKPYLETLISDDDLEEKIISPLLNQPIEKLLEEAINEMWAKLTPAQQAIIPGGFQGMKKLALDHFSANPHLLEEMRLHVRAEMKIGMDTVINPEGTKAFVETMCEAFGILSLTIKPDNDLMWAHYSANHTGMVIEFDTSHDFFTHRFSEKDDLSGPKAVVYSTERPTIKSLYALSKVADEEGARVWEPLVLTKSQSWAYEGEWRMVRGLSKADKIIDAVSPSIHLFRLPASCVSGLILGAQMPNEKQQSIVDFVRTDPRYAHVVLSQAKISRRTFAVEIERL